ncbi:MAG: hypothetical protein IJ461_00720 [Clostridia bacterium]|nr:hypothetical protein [Clostridia bacterium]
MTKGKSTLIIVVLSLLTLVFGALYFATDLDAETKAAQIESLSVDAAQKAERIETLTTADAQKAAQLEILTAADAQKAAQIEALTAADAQKAAQIEALTAADAQKAAQIEALTAADAQKAAQIEILTAADAQKAAQIEALTAVESMKDAQIAQLTAQLTTQEDLSEITEGTCVSTKRFVKLLKEYDVLYRVSNATDDSDSDMVEFLNTGTSTNGTEFSYLVNMFFYKDNSSVDFYLWNLVEFDASRYEEALKTCNELNSKWKWGFLSVNKENAAFNYSYMIPLMNQPSDGELLLNAFLNIHDIVTYCYDDLYAYRKQ